MIIFVMAMLHRHLQKCFFFSVLTDLFLFEGGIIVFFFFLFNNSINGLLNAFYWRITRLAAGDAEAEKWYISEFSMKVK